ncbi:MAG: hypothetical protein LJE93_13380 [Acidobacteria bacterium]|jgi:predicted amidohydrolase YtcJ|nr:hypothetical protein [Acidobacteriota bacterium]
MAALEVRISVGKKLEAHTIDNSATAAFERDIHGSINAGKPADITVVNRNLLEIDPE